MKNQLSTLNQSTHRQDFEGQFLIFAADEVDKENRQRVESLLEIYVVIHSSTKFWLDWAVVVTQLVERSLPILEVCSSNPVIGIIYIEHLIIVTVLKRRK